MDKGNTLNYSDLPAAPAYDKPVPVKIDVLRDGYANPNNLNNNGGNNYNNNINNNNDKNTTWKIFGYEITSLTGLLILLILILIIIWLVWSIMEYYKKDKIVKYEENFFKNMRNF